MATLTSTNILQWLNESAVGSKLRKGLQVLFDKIYVDIVAVEARCALLETSVVNCTASTLTVTAATHAGRTVTLNRAAGIDVTLPAATGTGNRYKFIVGTTFTANGTIKVVGDDIMVGHAILAQDSADTVVQFGTAADSDTITFYTAASNTTGGIKGAIVDLIDIAADTWHVVYISEAGGTEATPFSATVS
jgi:hypothetical protein